MDDDARPTRQQISDAVEGTGWCLVLGAIYSDVRRSKALIAAVRAATVTDASGNALDMAELLGEKSGQEPQQASEQADEATVDA